MSYCFFFLLLKGLNWEICVLGGGGQIQVSDCSKRLWLQLFACFCWWFKIETESSKLFWSKR